MRGLFSVVVVVVGSWAANAVAQDAVPSASALTTPDSYARPSRGLGGEALPEPPEVELDGGAAPDGYGGHARRPSDAALHVVHYGGGPFRLFLTEAERGRQEVCTTPCLRDVEPGRYRVSVARPRSGPRLADDPDVYLSPGTNIVQVHYDHRVGERSLGWTLFLFGASLGASLIPLGLFVALFVTVPVVGVFTLIGLPLMFLGDSARFEIYQPGSTPDPR